MAKSRETKKNRESLKGDQYTSYRTQRGIESGIYSLILEVLCWIAEQQVTLAVFLPKVRGGEGDPTDQHSLPSVSLGRRLI